MKANVAEVGKATRFQKGQSGNPKGRPKVLKLTHLLERELATPAHGSAIPKAEQLVHVVVQRALAGERWACELIWDRLEGKAQQRVVVDLEREAAKLAEARGLDKGQLIDLTRRLAAEAG